MLNFTHVKIDDTMIFCFYIFFFSSHNFEIEWKKAGNHRENRWHNEFQISFRGIVSSALKKKKCDLTGGTKKSEMSGARLCSLVAELGYEGAGKLDPDSFEWPFQYDDARPILDWICSSLRPSNVLSLAELSLCVFFSILILDSHPFSFDSSNVSLLNVFFFFSWLGLNSSWFFWIR